MRRKASWIVTTVKLEIELTFQDDALAAAFVQEATGADTNSKPFSQDFAEAVTNNGVAFRTLNAPIVVKS